MVCGAILTLLPEGGCKHIVRVLCSAALICAILEPVMGFDFESYAVESVKLRQMENVFKEDAGEISLRLNRTVIERQYCEYILDKAHELGLDSIEVTLDTQWHADGLWLPYYADITGRWDDSHKKRLEMLIRDDLGIPEERQHWEHE